MSNKELAYSIIDGMSEKQLEAFIGFVKGFADIPNSDTLEAIREVEDMKRHPENYKSYTDVDAMFKELLA